VNGHWITSAAAVVLVVAKLLAFRAFLVWDLHDYFPDAHQPGGGRPACLPPPGPRRAAFLSREERHVGTGHPGGCADPRGLESSPSTDETLVRLGLEHWESL